MPGKSSFRVNGSRCLTCAIVGNAGNVHGSGYGKLIDSKDIIIRYEKEKMRCLYGHTLHQSTQTQKQKAMPPCTVTNHALFLHLSACQTLGVEKGFITLRTKINIHLQTIPLKLILCMPRLVNHYSSS